MTLSEKSAYLKGLMDGLKLDALSVEECADALYRKIMQAKA